MGLKGLSEDDFISLHYTFLTDLELTQRISAHTVSTRVVNDKIWLEILKGPAKSLVDHLEELGVSGRSVHFEVVRDSGQRVCVARVYVVIVGVDDVVLRFVHVVALMTVPLVGVQVNNQELFEAIPQLHVGCDKRDIRVDAEAATVFTSRMMVTTAEIDGPASVACYAGGVHATPSRTHHGVKHSHPHKPGW